MLVPWSYDSSPNESKTPQSSIVVVGASTMSLLTELIFSLFFFFSFFSFSYLILIHVIHLLVSFFDTYSEHFFYCAWEALQLWILYSFYINLWSVLFYLYTNTRTFSLNMSIKWLFPMTFIYILLSVHISMWILL